MRSTIVKIGRFKLVTLITVIAILLAIIINYLVSVILGHDELSRESVIRSFIIPLIIAPFISWYLLGLFFELDRLENKMAYLAKYDGLTGLLRRNTFYEASSALHKRVKVNEKLYSILYIDIDYFKKINDEYGHASGDEVLKSFGIILQNLTQSGVISSRIGGEEFALVIPFADKKEALSFAEKLQDDIKSNTVKIENKTINYTASIGISTFNHDQDTNLQDVLKRADAALYTAKRSGRNRIVVK